MAKTTIDLEVNAKEAVQSLKEFVSQTTNLLKRIDGTLSNLTNAADTFENSIDGRKIASQFKTVSDAADAQQKVIDELAKSFEDVSKISKDSADELKKVADEFQDVAKSSDNADQQVNAAADSLRQTEKAAEDATDELRRLVELLNELQTRTQHTLAVTCW